MIMNKISKNVYELIKLASDQGFEVEFSVEGYSRLGDTFDYVTDVFRVDVSCWCYSY